jgi:hypothetical protein
LRLQAQAQAQAQARQPFASDDSIGATPPLDRHDAQVEDSVRIARIALLLLSQKFLDHGPHTVDFVAKSGEGVLQI